MATVNEKMTALADEIRELSGTTASKSIDAMTTDVNAANTEIAEQTELLDQIATALEGKGSGGGSTKTCTVTINNSLNNYWYYSYTAYENSQIIGKSNATTAGSGVNGNTITLYNVICGSTITIMDATGVMTAYSSADDETVQFVGNRSSSGVIVFTAPTEDGVAATITLGTYTDY